MMNTYSGKNEKVFTFDRNECSRSAGIGVHVEPEWVFMIGRNMHTTELFLAMRGEPYMTPCFLHVSLLPAFTREQHFRMPRIRQTNLGESNL
jgi:hypothetical protein